MRKIFLLMASTLISGCASNYLEPNTKTTFVDFRTSESLGRDSNQLYQIRSDNTCQEAEGFGNAANLLSIFGHKSSKTVAIRPNERAFIIAKNTSGTATSESICAINFSFIPEEGKTYTIQGEQINGKCGLTIYDTTNKQQPESLIIYNTQNTCQ